MDKLDQFIHENMPKFDDRIVEEFMKEYDASEEEARRSLSEQLFFYCGYNQA